MSKSKPKILLIEDDPILGDMYVDTFKQAGLETVLASSAEEGWKLIKKAKPDLVVLDILLPEKNGIFFLKKLRKDPILFAMPVIAFSNYDDLETERQALKLGAKDYLLKTSYTPKAIIRRIKKYLKST